MLSTISFGQSNRSSFIVNIGVQQANAYKKLFWSQTTLGLVPTSQNSYAFFDINFLYSMPTKKPNLNTILGIGINQKGFIEKGFDYLSDPGTSYYTSILRKTYLTFFGGINYEISFGKKMKLTLAQFLTPEIDLNKSDLYKRFSLGTRTTFIISHKIEKKFSISMAPFFQTAILKYNASKLTEISSNYIPYCFGLELGLVFNK